ncbi:MAG: carboxypeptidase regulatory-like domain-containing protein [Bosea sp.]|nr:carboxypeptidase regulatory-like domain-containing protein [Bosea sp. (in: a-proteobacteria)]
MNVCKNQNYKLSNFIRKMTAGLVMKHVVIAMLISGILTACQTVTIDSQFDIRQAQTALEPGTNRIEGNAFLRQRGGSVVTAAGEVVRLIPATRYAEERFQKIYGGNKFAPLLFANRTENTNADYIRLTRETKADAQGNFQFENVKPGRYIVMTRVVWAVPGSSLPEGGSIFDYVEIRGERQTVKTVISGN